MIAVYKITNSLNKKMYIGQTVQPTEKRFLQHSKAESPLGQAMRQCGLENFTIEVIEECETKSQADEREKFWISVLKCKVPNGYNRTDGGAGCCGCHTERKRSFESRLQVAPPVRSLPKMTVAESLKRFRREFRLSQKDVADAIGTTQQAYQVYERNSYPSAKIILRLADAYDVSTDYLLGRSDEPRPPKFDEKTLNLVRAMQAFQSAPPAQGTAQ